MKFGFQQVVRKNSNKSAAGAQAGGEASLPCQSAAADDVEMRAEGTSLKSLRTRVFDGFGLRFVAFWEPFQASPNQILIQEGEPFVSCRKKPAENCHRIGQFRLSNSMEISIDKSGNRVPISDESETNLVLQWNSLSTGIDSDLWQGRSGIRPSVERFQGARRVHFSRGKAGWSAYRGGISRTGIGSKQRISRCRGFEGCSFRVVGLIGYNR